MVILTTVMVTVTTRIRDTIRIPTIGLITRRFTSAQASIGLAAIAIIRAITGIIDITGTKGVNRI
jgi:hypothetical protein